jgi:hypothetical protein
VQFATSVCYNRDLTKKIDKDKINTRTLFLHSGSSPPDGALLPGHATNTDRKDTSVESAKEVGSPGDAPAPSRPWPICKGNHWRSKCPHLQTEGRVPLPLD